MAGLYCYAGPDVADVACDAAPHRGRETVALEVPLSGGSCHLRLGRRPSDHDPAAGRRSARYTVLFDGRIHNRPELLRLLAGDVDATAGDAQIAGALLARYPSDPTARLNGPFALVALDRGRERLTAIRDRFGMRPLYVRDDGETLELASEIKQFFSSPRASARVAPDACLDFLIDGLTDHSRSTMFEGIHRLGPAERLDVDLRDRRRAGPPLPSSPRWYDPPAPGSVELTDDQASARFRELLLDSVGLCWDADRAHALCLSGGIDSATIACALAHASGAPVTALKVNFEDPRYDEPDLLNAVLARVPTTLHTTSCTGRDALAHLPELVWHLDEPYSRASLAGQWRLFRRAAELGVAATLDGQGADELLGGYRSMVAEDRAFAAAAADNHRQRPTGPESSRAIRSAGTRSADAYAWLAADWRDLAVARRSAQAPRAARPLGELCRHRLNHGDLPMMMRHNDRIGSAHGVETSVPYLDHRVVDLCIGLGGEHKLRNGQTKYLLRRAFADLLPPAVVASAVKGSYSDLEAGWFRGEISSALVDGARTTALAWPSIFDSGGVIALTRSPARASKAALMLCWRILAFGAWMERFAVAP